MEEKGKTFYCWDEIETGKSTGTSDKQGIKADKKVNKDQFMMIDKCLSSLNWSFKPTKAEQAALEDKHELPVKAQMAMQQAINKLKALLAKGEKVMMSARGTSRASGPGKTALQDLTSSLFKGRGVLSRLDSFTTFGMDADGSDLDTEKIKKVLYEAAQSITNIEESTTIGATLCRKAAA